MARMIAAVLASMFRTMQTAVDKIVNCYFRVVATGLSAFGFGSPSPLPSQDPVFKAPVAPEALFSDLVAGPAPTAKIRDLDSEGVNSVFRLAKMSKDERATADLSAVERDDVRALLLTMTQSELDALTKAGPGPVRRLIVGGDAQVWGVPSVKLEAVMTPSQTELAMRLRAVKAAMAKPNGSKPFVMPNM